MQRKYKLFVTCDMSQKIENSGMTCGVKSSNFGFIFEARTKSWHDVQKNTFFLDIMREFCLSINNEAEIWIFITTLFLCTGIFDKVAVTLRFFKQIIEKWTKSLTSVFRTSWKPLSVQFLHLYQNYWIYPIFCAKLPPHTKISIALLFFVPHGFPASHFEA